MPTYISVRSLQLLRSWHKNPPLHMPHDLWMRKFMIKHSFRALWWVELTGEGHITKCRAWLMIWLVSGPLFSESPHPRALAMDLNWHLLSMAMSKMDSQGCFIKGSWIPQNLINGSKQTNKHTYIHVYMHTYMLEIVNSNWCTQWMKHMSSSENEIMQGLIKKVDIVEQSYI